MKTSSDFIHRLVHSLSRSEKRYFSLFAQRHAIGGKSNYLALFEAINKQGVYNEEALKKKFSKNFTREKIV